MSLISYVCRKKSSDITVLKVDRQDYPTIRFNAKESVQMPFRKSIDFEIQKYEFNPCMRKGYIAVGGKALLPPGMKELLKEDLDKGFDPLLMPGEDTG
jgi:ribosome biogenesis SPOUT family RNA methylase Rps3